MPPEGRKKKEGRASVFWGAGFAVLIVVGCAALFLKAKGPFEFGRIETVPLKVVMTEAPSATLRKTVRVTYTVKSDKGASALFAHVVSASRDDAKAPRDITLPLQAASLENGPGRGYFDIGFSPWAGREVFVSLIVRDKSGREARTEPWRIIAPMRVFRDPLARALMEEREKIMGDPSSATRMEAANVMAGIARRYDSVRHDTFSVLALRSGAVRLALNRDARAIEQVVDGLWRIAFRVEEGAPGRARALLGEKVSAFLDALGPDMDPRASAAFLGALARAGEAYLKTCEAEADCGLVRFLFEAQGKWPKDVFQSAFEDVVWAIRDQDSAKARKATRVLQAVVEEMPTIRPEMSPDQDVLAGKIFALRDFARAQKELFDATRQIEAMPNGKNKNVLEDLSKKQRALFLALKEREETAFSSIPGIEKSRTAMEVAARLLEQGVLGAARERQAEALGLLENALLALSEAMRRSSSATEESKNF